MMTIGQMGVLIACSGSDASDDLANASAPVMGDTPTSTTGNICLESVAQDSGPFYTEERRMRSDLTVDTLNIDATNGAPLDLEFAVYGVDGTTCTPLEGVQVDIWSADTTGKYSGMCTQGTEGDDSLRGYQITDADGIVRFKTIFPGWYRGRTIHLHVTLRLSSGSTQLVDFTTQLYIAEELVNRVMATAPYNSRGAQDTTNTTDFLFTSPPIIGGTPIRLPPDACEQAAAGVPAGRPPGIPDTPPPPVTEGSMGPRLLLDMQEKSGGGGFSGRFTFGVKMA